VNVKVQPAPRAALKLTSDTSTTTPAPTTTTDLHLAHLCGAAPLPASSGKTTRHRFNPGGHREANEALWRIVLVRMKSHVPTRTYVARRTAEGLSKREIMRCLKSATWPARSTATSGPPTKSTNEPAHQRCLCGVTIAAQ
jgi:hypothetical protein